MRTTLLAISGMLVMLAVCAPAAAEDAAAEVSAPAAEDAVEEFKPPPGFRKRTRGKHVVYCRRESVRGTRMEQEKCYDRAGLREMEMIRREDQQKIDQIRRSRSATGI
jgi:hypothetical protein